jgi:hypothetical protein
VALPRRDWERADLPVSRSTPARIIPVAHRLSSAPADQHAYNAVVQAMARIVREALDAERESRTDKSA